MLWWTISYGLCWIIDSRKRIWPPRAHFGSENESLKGLTWVFSLPYRLVRPSRQRAVPPLCKTCWAGARMWPRVIRVWGWQTWRHRGGTASLSAQSSTTSGPTSCEYYCACVYVHVHITCACACVQSCMYACVDSHPSDLFIPLAWY